MKPIFDFIKKVKPPILPLILLILTLIIGSIGYFFIWRDYNASLFDGLYMTFTTITTIGYGELKPLNDGGRLFTMFLALCGIGSLFFVLSSVMEKLFILELDNVRGKRKMQKKIDSLNSHIILVGFGRVGKLSAKELLRKNIKFVAIDQNFENSTNEEFENMLKVEGDATNDAILEKAGIAKAKGMIIATANSATTVFIALSAKAINPNIFIVARANDKFAIDKLKKVGADRVVSPYDAGGKLLANLIANPNLVDFFESSFSNDSDGFRIETIELPDNSNFIGKSIKEIDIRKKCGANIVAVVRNSKAEVNPNGEFRICSKDQLVSLGSKQQLEALEELVNKSKF